MSIIGFNFTKISAERKNNVVGTVNINNRVSLKDVKEAKIGLAGDRAALRVTFAFESEYSPDLALLAFEGDALVLVETKEMAGIIENWNKSKQLPRTVVEPLMNHVLERCNIQALLLSKDLNLPSPVPLPKVQMTMPGEQPSVKDGQVATPLKAPQAKPAKPEVKTTKLDKRKSK